MKKIATTLSVFALLLLLSACEEQPIVIEQMAPQTNRKILIEEFTGVNCAACPAGATLIKTLQEEFGEQVVAVSIHTTYSASLGTLSGTTYDLREPDGDAMFDYTGGFTGIPAASFNRTQFNGQQRIAVGSPPSWPSFALDELNIDPIVEVETNLIYEEATRELTINVDATSLVDKTGDFRIGVMITESHIIDKQNNAGTIEDDYEHNHVLRKYITDVGGESLTSTLEINKTISKTFNFTIPAEDGIWVAENCNVVVFVSEVDADEGTINVLQADEEHLGE